MATLTLSLFDAMMKELYIDGVPQNVASRNRAFLTKVKKRDGFYGDVMPIPIFHGNPPGRSATFAKALANAKPSAQKKWLLTQKSDYGVVEIDALTMKASGNDKGAFVAARKSQIDMMLDQIGHSASVGLYGNGSGSIGKISNVSGQVLTLYNADDIKNFSIGQVIAANPTETGNVGTMRSGVGVVTVLNESEGKITHTGTISSIAQNDFLYSEGDYDAKIVGLAGWIPSTAPSGSENFLGVDRSVDNVRLAGVRQNETTMSVEENLLTLAERIVKVGGRPDWAFCSHTRFSDLVKGLGSKVAYDGAGGGADVGFAHVDVHTSGGVTRVYPDPDCPSDRLYVLTSSTWTLWHLGGMPHIAQDDGLMATRMSGSDGIEVRGRYYANLACTAPGWNGVALL
jgi:hypothetical protein